MKEKIVLIGAGQHCNVVMYNIMVQNKYDTACIIDVDKKIWGTNINGTFVESGYSDFNREYLFFLKDKYNTNKFFICIGAMKLRKPLFDFFYCNGWESVNIIHPDAVVSPYARLGNGILVECGCLITPQPKIGDNVVVNTGSQVNHDNVIEDHVYYNSP